MIFFTLSIIISFVAVREKKKEARIEDKKNENEIVLEIANSPPSIKIMGVIFLRYDNNTVHYKIRQKYKYDTSYQFWEKGNRIIIPPRKGKYNKNLTLID